MLLVSLALGLRVLQTVFEALYIHCEEVAIYLQSAVSNCVPVSSGSTECLEADSRPKWSHLKWSHPDSARPHLTDVYKND
jgi:hypothetical protein